MTASATTSSENPNLATSDVLHDRLVAILHGAGAELAADIGAAIVSGLGGGHKYEVTTSGVNDKAGRQDVFASVTVTSATHTATVTLDSPTKWRVSVDGKTFSARNSISALIADVKKAFSTKPAPQATAPAAPVAA